MFKTKGEIQELNPSQLHQIYRMSAGHPGRLLMRLLWETGMQLREAVALKVEDVRFEDNVIRIVGTAESRLRRGEPTPVTGRRKRKERWIPIPGVLFYPLHRYCLGRKPGEFLCYTRHPHAPLSSRTLECFIKQLGPKLGIPGLSSSAFRDTFILYNLRCATPLEALQKHMGYSNRRPFRRYLKYLGVLEGRIRSPAPYLEQRRA